MPQESFFMAMGGMGLSLAGFAGLISALDRGAERSPITAYRITGIVLLGFMLTLAGFGTVAAYTMTSENLGLTVQVGTVLLVLPIIRGFLAARPGPAWPDEGERRFTLAGLVVLLIITVANLVVDSLGYLMFLMITALIGPAQIFYNTVRDAARPRHAVSGDR